MDDIDDVIEIDGRIECDCRTDWACHYHQRLLAQEARIQHELEPWRAKRRRAEQVRYEDRLRAANPEVQVVRRQPGLYEPQGPAAYGRTLEQLVDGEYETRQEIEHRQFKERWDSEVLIIGDGVAATRSELMRALKEADKLPAGVKP